MKRSNRLRFQPSQLLSMGVELELQLINQEDGELAPRAPEMLKKLVHLSGLKPEITQSMLEINSGIHETVDTLSADLCHLRSILLKAADQLGIAVCGGGAHPFQKWQERKIYPDARFEQLLSRYGYLAKQFTVFGQHIHLGVDSPDKAIRLIRALGRYIPQLIALSASSPFYQGADTAFASSRLSIVSAFPLSGTMPPFDSWAEFEAHVGRLRAAGIIESLKDLYWDVRPKPEYGTVEIRICDTPVTLVRAADLAAYAQTLAAWLLDTDATPRPDEDLAYAYNRFQACRFGLDGVLHLPDAPRVTIGEDILEVLPRLQPFARTAQTRASLARIGAQAREGGNDAGWLRAQLESAGDLASVIRAQCSAWAASGN